MPIEFRCEHCRQRLSAPSRKAGDRIRCPVCREPTIVPAPQIEWAPAEPSPPPELPPAPEPEPPPPSPVAAPPEPVTSPVPAESRTAAPPEERGTVRDRPQVRTTDEAEAAPRRRVKFGKRGGDDEEMDLTPMVDVVFLLLIFFMITASFSRQKSMETPPPDPEKKGAQQSPEFLDDLEDVSIRVVIDEQDNVLVEEELVADLGQLADVLAQVKLKEDKSELLLSPHDAARHETVVKVLDAAQDVGLQRIRMTSGGGDE